MALPAALAAECRFVVSGRITRLDVARRVFLVKSESSERTYEVTVAHQGDALRGTCTCPAGIHSRHGSEMCKHIAGCMRRLEREHLARFDGTRWLMTSKLEEVA